MKRPNGSRKLLAGALAIAMLAAGFATVFATSAFGAGRPLILKTVSARQLADRGITLTVSARKPVISRRQAAVIASRQFPGTKILEMASGTVNEAAPARQYFAWIVSAWPPPAPTGKGFHVPAGNSPSSGYLVIFLDAVTGKFILAVSQSSAHTPNVCNDGRFGFPNPLQRTYRLVHGRWIRPKTRYNRRIGQHLPALYTGERVRFTLTIRPSPCMRIASVHLRFLPAHWNSRGDPQYDWCSCTWPGPRLPGMRTRSGAWRYVRQMHLLRHPPSHLLLGAWSILTTNHTWIGIGQLFRVYPGRQAT